MEPFVPREAEQNVKYIICDTKDGSNFSDFWLHGHFQNLVHFAASSLCCYPPGKPMLAAVA